MLNHSPYDEMTLLRGFVSDYTKSPEEFECLYREPASGHSVRYVFIPRMIRVSPNFIDALRQEGRTIYPFRR